MGSHLGSDQPVEEVMRGLDDFVRQGKVHSVKALNDMRAIVVDYPRRYSIGEIDP